MEFSNNITEVGRKTIDTMVEIWTDIGYSKDMINCRLKQAVTYIQELCTEMVTEAQDSKKAIVEDIEKLKLRIESLKQQLKLNEHDARHDGDATLFSIKTQLETKIDSLKKQVEARVQLIRKLVGEERQYSKSLDLPPKDLPTKPCLPSEQDVEDYKIHIDRLRQTLFEREELYLHLKVEVSKLMEQLGLQPSLDFERTVLAISDDSFHVSQNNMDRLRRWHEDLLSQLKHSKRLVEDLREKISELWELLQVSPTERSTFLTNHTGCTVQTINALKLEVSRCHEMKIANIKKFVEKLRCEIGIWCEKCCYGPKQRSEVLIESDCFTEDLLAAHELELEKLKRFYKTHQHIFELLDKRQHLCETMMSLEKKALSPNRYKNRGGQLLNEERKRKLVAKQLPQVENIILKEVEKYQSENGIPFLARDKNVKNLIEEARTQIIENKNKIIATKTTRNELTPRNKVLTTGNSHSKVINVIGSSNKRIVYTPLDFGSKRTKLFPNEGNGTTKSCPTIKVTGRSIKKRLSRRAVRRLEISHRMAIAAPTSQNLIPGNSLEKTVPDYKLFEDNLPDKELCRSSVLPRSDTGEVVVSKSGPRILQPIPQPSSLVSGSTYRGATPD